MINHLRGRWFFDQRHTTDQVILSLDGDHHGARRLSHAAYIVCKQASKMKRGDRRGQKEEQAKLRIFYHMYALGSRDSVKQKLHTLHMTTKV